MMDKEFKDLDFDNIELGGDIDDDDLNSLADFGEVSAEVLEPHIKISTKSYLTLLRLAKQVSSTAGRDVITKSILFSVEGDQVVVRATDLDTFFEYKIECLNTENVLHTTFSVPLDILIKVARALPSTTVFIQREDKIYIRLFGEIYH